MGCDAAVTRIRMKGCEQIRKDANTYKGLVVIKLCESKGYRIFQRGIGVVTGGITLFSGAGGRRFESAHPDQYKPLQDNVLWGFCFFC